MEQKGTKGTKPARGVAGVIDAALGVLRPQSDGGQKGRKSEVFVRKRKYVWKEKGGMIPS
jgi:hypothetical protein